jgi:hypothetical protein
MHQRMSEVYWPGWLLRRVEILEGVKLSMTLDALHLTWFAWKVRQALRQKLDLT